MAVRRMLTWLKVATSRRMFVVSSVTSVSSPPMTPATATGPPGSVIRSCSGPKVCSIPSNVVIFSPGMARRTMMVMLLDGVVVEGMNGLSELQHHEVGDIDDVVDRPHSSSNELLLHPGWRRADLDRPR